MKIIDPARYEIEAQDIYLPKLKQPGRYVSAAGGVTLTSTDYFVHLKSGYTGNVTFPNCSAASEGKEYCVRNDSGATRTLVTVGGVHTFLGGNEILNGRCMTFRDNGVSEWLLVSDSSS